jgi:hypothetical protein
MKDIIAQSCGDMSGIWGKPRSGSGENAWMRFIERESFPKRARE